MCRPADRNSGGLWELWTSGNTRTSRGPPISRVVAMSLLEFPGFERDPMIFLARVGIWRLLLLMVSKPLTLPVFVRLRPCSCSPQTVQHFTSIQQCIAKCINSRVLFRGYIQALRGKGLDTISKTKTEMTIGRTVKRNIFRDSCDLGSIGTRLCRARSSIFWLCCEVRHRSGDV